MLELDMHETIDEIDYLLGDAKRKLTAFLRDIRSSIRHIHADTYEGVTHASKAYREQLEFHTKQVGACRRRASSGELSREDITHIDRTISAAREYLRSHASLLGALITSTDWQSPSFAHAFHSQAGRETGKIYATINDYKRDQHWDAHRYEEKFRKEYIDALIKIPIHVDATSSGMAAFTTILIFLLCERKITGKIICGQSIYFENKSLLAHIFPDTLITVDESDTRAVIDAIDTHHPSAVILDSLTNSPQIQTPDCPGILRHLIRHATGETYFIVDNTGLSFNLQLISHMFAKRTPVRLILFESLNKYHQFGFDRVTGGIIISYGKNTEKIFDWRVHAGTNIPDAAAAALPTPNRKLLARRFARHTRNATFLATAMKQWITDHPDSPFLDISYPGVGSYFTIIFTPASATIPNFRRFVSLSLTVAKKYKVNLVSGTSFGLNDSRIYLTAIRSKPNTPFIRIAAGTEHMHAMEAIRNIFLETMRRYR